jgi:hypothetical protein
MSVKHKELFKKVYHSSCLETTKTFLSNSDYDKIPCKWCGKIIKGVGLYANGCHWKCRSHIPCLGCKKIVKNIYVRKDGYHPLCKPCLGCKKTHENKVADHDGYHWDCNPNKYNKHCEHLLPILPTNEFKYFFKE